MASEHQVAVAYLPDFQKRVLLFLEDKAVDTINEEIATPGTHSAEVLDGCRTIIRGRLSLNHISLAVVSNGTLATAIGTSDAATANSAITDNDLSYVVKTEMFGAFATSLKG